MACEDSNTFCARPQVTTDPVPLRVVRSRRCRRQGDAQPFPRSPVQRQALFEKHLCPGVTFSPSLR